MTSARGLLAAVAGVAVLAMPMTAAAFDHHHHYGAFRSAYLASQPTAWKFRGAPRTYVAAPTFAPRFRPRVAPYAVTAAPIVPTVWSPATTPAYANYGYFTPAPMAAPVMGYSGWAHPNACANAQRAIGIAQTDRMRGHPAAAASVLRQSAGARANCNGAGGLAATSVYGYNGGYPSPFSGLLGGVTAVPASGYGYNAPYPAYRYGNRRSYGYNGGYTSPLGGWLGGATTPPVTRHGYNAPYTANPYGNRTSPMTTPLLSRFIR